jgi:hypothetical protein
LLPVEDFVKFRVGDAKDLVVRRDRLGVEEARQPVMGLGEAGPGIEVALGGKDLLPSSTTPSPVSSVP